MRAWQAIIKRDIHYIDPGHFASAKSPTRAWHPPNRSRPSLYCVGRSERRKGNDLFIELVRWLDPSSFDATAHIGDEDRSSDAAGSAYILEQIAEARGIRVEHRRPLDRSGLSKLFETPSIIVLPTRYNSLNLVALDSLFSGCPLAVSSNAGVCDYLDETHPNLPYVKMNLENFYASVPPIRDLIENYDEHRRLLHAKLAQNPPVPVSAVNIGAVYDAILAAPPRARNALYDLPHLEHESAPRQGRTEDLKAATVAPKNRASSRRRLTWRLKRPRIRGPLRQFRQTLGQFVMQKLSASGYFGDPRFFSATIDSLQLRRRLKHVSRRREHNQDMLKERLEANYQQCVEPPVSLQFLARYRAHRASARQRAHRCRL